MDRRLAFGQSDPGSIPATGKLFSINCVSLISVFSYRCSRLGIDFGDFTSVTERREEVSVYVFLCVCVCERERERERQLRPSDLVTRPFL